MRDDYVYLAFILTSIEMHRKSQQQCHPNTTSSSVLSLPILTHLIGIGMVLFGQLKVGLFNLALIGAFIHPQNFVKVSFGR